MQEIPYREFPSVPYSLHPSEMRARTSSNRGGAGAMVKRGIVLVLAAALAAGVGTPAGEKNRITAEVKFEGVTYVEKRAGVWIDGQYLGYLKELKGKRKIALLPGDHEIVVRRAGY